MGCWLSKGVLDSPRCWISKGVWNLPMGLLDSQGVLNFQWSVGFAGWCWISSGVWISKGVLTFRESILKQKKIEWNNDNFQYFAEFILLFMTSSSNALTLSLCFFISSFFLSSCTYTYDWNLSRISAKFASNLMFCVSSLLNCTWVPLFSNLSSSSCFLAAVHLKRTFSAFFCFSCPVLFSSYHYSMISSFKLVISS